MFASKVRASGLHDPPHCGQAHVTICHVSAAAAAHDARRSGYKTLPARPGARSIRHQVPENKLESGFPGVGWSCVSSAVCRLQPAALWKQHDSLRNASCLSSCCTPEFTIREKVREKLPITSTKWPILIRDEFFKTSCRRGCPNIHSFSLFLSCFVLFCFDSRRRLPSDVCLPLSGEAFCACAQGVSGKRSQTCDSSTGVNSSWMRQHVGYLL